MQFQPIARLNKLAGLKELHWLRLFNCQASDEAMKDLVDLPKLSFLDVAYNPVTDESFTHVASRLPHIKQLLAYYTRLTDKGLAELAKLPELDSVQLMNTSITDAGLAALAPIRTSYTPISAATILPTPVLSRSPNGKGSNILD